MTEKPADKKLSRNWLILRPELRYIITLQSLALLIYADWLYNEFHGNIYLRLWLWPLDPNGPIPAAFIGTIITLTLGLAIAIPIWLWLEWKPSKKPEAQPNV